ncbi:WD40-repeat-containing domain protein [Polychytrium aggregatum]|uniref:WD40-repeat-containing domain protein n=1 Tax=Polychytrium aggregatum TaxID=110093 RepID=UPI0022FDC563|nr:WD40-repeat-containing domain protein [Polychytrium aggregatum]KAI9205912.1 WD40-repeat-containing domain protein [Polychytrium aggregatum]
MPIDAHPDHNPVGLPMDSAAQPAKQPDSPDAGPPVGLQAMPDEVLLMIFARLSAETLVRVRLVSRLWYRLIDHGPSFLWKQICCELWQTPASLSAETRFRHWFWKERHRYNLRWMSKQYKFEFFEEPLDLFFASTVVSVSGNLMVYGSDDTHTIFTRRLTDQLIVRRLDDMRVIASLPGYRVHHLCLYQNLIFSADYSPHLRVQRLAVDGHITPQQKHGDWSAEQRLQQSPGEFGFPASLLQPPKGSHGDGQRPCSNRNLDTSPTNPIPRQHHDRDSEYQHQRSAVQDQSTCECRWSGHDNDPNQCLPTSTTLECAPIDDEPIVRIVCDEASRTLVCGFISGLMRFWTLPDLKPLEAAHDFTHITQLAITPDYLFVGGGALDNQFLGIYGISTRKLLYVIRCSYSDVQEMAAARGITVGRIQEYHVWTVESISAQGSLVACNYGVQGVYIIFDVKRLAQNENPLVSIIDESFRDLTKFHTPDRGYIRLGLYNPKIAMHDRFLFTASLRKSEISVWDLHTGARLYRLSEPFGTEVGPLGQHELVTSISDMRLSPDGRMLIVSAFGGMLYVWRVDQETIGAASDADTGEAQRYSSRCAISRNALGRFIGERTQRLSAAKAETRLGKRY